MPKHFSKAEAADKKYLSKKHEGEEEKKEKVKQLGLCYSLGPFSQALT